MCFYKQTTSSRRQFAKFYIIKQNMSLNYADVKMTVTTSCPINSAFTAILFFVNNIAQYKYLHRRTEENILLNAIS